MGKGARSHFLRPFSLPAAGPVQMGAQLSCLRPQRSQPGAHLPECTRVSIQKAKGRGLCMCVFAGDAVPHPPSCCCSRREQDALTLSCTFGAWKPQPRQQRVHRAGWRGPRRQAVQVCANLHMQGQRGVWFPPRPPSGEDGLRGRRELDSLPQGSGNRVQPL